MNKGSLTEKLRGSHLAKIVILLIATMAIGGLAGCSSVSAQPGTSSTSTSTGNGSSTGTTPTPDPSTTDTPTQQPSQSQSTGATSDIDNASTDQQVSAFIQAFKDAGFPDVEQQGLAGVNANWGPSYSCNIGVRSLGVNLWSIGVSTPGTPVTQLTISIVKDSYPNDQHAQQSPGFYNDTHGISASVILKIIDSIYFKDGVVYQK